MEQDDTPCKSHYFQGRSDIRTGSTPRDECTRPLDADTLSDSTQTKRQRVNNRVKDAAATAACDYESPDEANRESLTEMEKQVVALQRRYADMMLLFECGYRMRMFGDHAETASRVLGIRAQRHRAFLEASVPVHRTLFHGRRLVDAGLKIGIVKQLSTVVRVHGQPLERDVVEVFTRATIPCKDTSDVDSGDGTEIVSVVDSARFMLSIVEQTVHSTRLFTKFVHELDADAQHAMPLENVRIGVFGYDIHTGECVFDEFEDGPKRPRLRELLDLVAPIEFVLPIGGVSPLTEQVLLIYSRRHAREDPFDDPNRQCDDQAMCRLERVAFDDQGIPSSLPTPSQSNALPALARVCFFGMTAYLQSLKLDTVLSLETLRASTTGNRLLTDIATKCMRISHAALRDLGIFSDKTSQDASLFSILNHTRTVFGARRLRDWTRFPLLDVKEIESRQACVEFLAAVGQDGAVMYEALRNDILPIAAPLERLLQQLHLRRSSAHSVARLLQTLLSVETHVTEIAQESRVRQANASPHKLRIHTLLADYPRTKHVLETALQELDGDATAANDMERMITKSWQTSPREQAEYETLCSELQVLETKFQDALAKCRLLLDLPALEYCSHRTGGHGKTFGHLVAIDRSDLARVPTDWIVVNSTKSLVRYYPRQVRALQVEQDLLLERKEQLVHAMWRRTMGKVDAAVYMQGMVCLETLAELDALCSFATTVRLYPGYIRPTLHCGDASSEDCLAIQCGRHPVLELEGTHGSSYIAADITLRVWGSVSRVGTEYGRQKYTAAHDGAAGSTGSNSAMRLRVFDAIHTRMHRRIHGIGKRHEAAGVEELRELAVVAKTATPQSLVVLDEVGYGLTSRQAKTLAFTTVKYLVQTVKCCVFMATHMTDVALRLQSEIPRVETHELAHQVAVRTLDPSSSSQLLDVGDSSTTGAAATVVYHYTTREGVATRSFAVEAAAMAGIPSTILDAVRGTATTTTSEVGNANKVAQEELHTL